MIDLGDEHGGNVLAIKLRNGKATANTVADHLDFLDAAVSSVPDNADGQPWGKRLLTRSGAGGGTQKLIDHIAPLGNGYLMRFRGSDAIGIIVSTTGKAAKSHILCPDGTPEALATGFIADITDRVRFRGLRRPPTIGINQGNFPAGCGCS